MMTRGGTPNRSLAQTAARGGAVLGVATVAEQVAQFLRALFLARILSPHDFGLMGMAIVVVFTAEALSQTGMNRAIVQKRQDPREDLDTVWVFSALRGVFLFAVVWMMAPAMAAFFETTEVKPILRAAGLAFPIQALVNPAFFLLERELAFARVAWPRLAGVLCDLAVSVGASLALRNVWGMVWGFLAGKAVYVVASYAARPWAPAFRPSFARARELYRYGRHVFRASVVDCVVGQGDRAFIGRLLGTDALGLYALATRVANLPSTGGLQIMFRVAFPIFSRVQEEAERLRSGLRRAFGLMCAIAFPIGAGLWVTADDLVPVLFGEKWMGMIPPFRVLCVAGAAATLYQLLRVILGAIGRPDTAAHGSYLYLLAFAAPLYPMILMWGSVGAAWCALAAAVVATSFLLRATVRLTGGRLTDTLRSGCPPFGAALVMTGAVAYGRAASGLAASAGLLVAEIVAGGVIYFVCLALLDRLLGTGLRAEVRPILGALGLRDSLPGPSQRGSTAS